jgi:hypothetical protein
MAQPQEENTVTQRLECCRAELLEKRQLELLQEVKQESAGSLHASSMAITGKESSTLLGSYK